MNGLSFHQLSLGSGHRNGIKGRKTLVETGVVFSKLLEDKRISIEKLNTISIEEVPRALQTMLEKKNCRKNCYDYLIFIF